jgi:hypothetical protein
MKLLIIAVFLLVAWALLRFTLAVTGAFLHLLWIIAIIMLVMWLIGKIRGGVAK